mmetsp:Transcript_18967/g.76127  ORF Transcript_18967/g.76127 Transcript_18967/m.76127 type:complete len:273 (+) Transcript_18967:343-1161(+)
MSEDPARRENLDEIGEFKGNPFKRRSVPLRWQGVVKVCLGLVVVPVRVMLCTTALCLMLGAIFAVTYGDPPRDLLQPQDRKKRKFVEKVSKLCGKIVMIVMGGWNVEEHLAVDPPEVSAPGTYVIVSNHVSFMDISYHVWRNAPAFIAKAEVSRIPIIGPLARAFQTIFVDRESGTTQSASMQLKSRLSVPGKPFTLAPCRLPSASGSPNPTLLVVGVCYQAFRQHSFSRRPQLPTMSFSSPFTLGPSLQELRSKFSSSNTGLSISTIHTVD